MLPTLVQRYDKNEFIFDPVETRETLKFYRLSDATFYNRINIIYQFIKPFFDKKKKKCQFLRNMEPLELDMSIVLNRHVRQKF